MRRHLLVLALDAIGGAAIAAATYLWVTERLVGRAQSDRWTAEIKEALADLEPSDGEAAESNLDRAMHLRLVVR